jgi:FkbM family methyltransferase
MNPQPRKAMRRGDDRTGMSAWNTPLKHRPRTREKNARLCHDRHVLGRYLATVPAVAAAMLRDRVTVDGVRVRIPGTRAIRASVLLGNVRLRAMLDGVLRPGATVVDVGANIGAIAAAAARRVGPAGRVIAIEPAADNVAVLRENIHANRLDNVTIVPGAAGRIHESREFYLRGDVSAVNSLFPESMYAAVTGVIPVAVAPLDDLVRGTADLVKIDVEGAEMDVLAGMSRLLAFPAVRLIVEWHPLLQQAAGYRSDALPRALLDHGFSLETVDHLRRRPLTAAGIASTCERLTAARRPVELFAFRSSLAASGSSG